MESITEYANAALRTSNPRAQQSQEEGQTYALMGLASEVGEIGEIIKKHYYHGHPWTQENYTHLKKELGDLAWYWVLMCRVSGVEPAEILEMNIEKLKARYPEGFTTEKSMNRAPGDI